MTATAMVQKSLGGDGGGAPRRSQITAPLAMSADRSVPLSSTQLSCFDPHFYSSDLPTLFEGAIAGVDEVGRGALFGPVVAAAVILSPEAEAELGAAGVTDSKQLSSDQRQQFALQIQERASACQIGLASVWEIDRLNILQASLLAMQRAIVRLSPPPKLCLIDGNQRVPNLLIPQQTLVKGDQQSVAIAAASIVAKVWRDRLLVRLAVKYPGYDLATNKGYGTPKHRQAIQRLGVSRQHRLSFSPCRLPSFNVSNV